MKTELESLFVERIIFGRGSACRLGQLLREFGTRVLVVTGRHPERHQPILESFGEANLSAEIFRVSGEPSVHSVLEAVQTARQFRPEVILGLGGGSALDTAKAIAGLLTNPGDPFEYLEVVGQGRPLPHRALPWVAAPTTAGSGAEVTRNAVLTAPEQRVKVSLRSPQLLARIVVVDPDLTLTNPPETTAWSGMDAVSQVLEPFVSRRRNPLSDGLCREALPRAAWALPRAFRRGDDVAAREAMSLVSLFGGLALTNAGLGAVHGIAGPLGGMIAAPHGALCARLLPPVFRKNWNRLREAGDAELEERFREAAHRLTGSDDPEHLVEWLEERNQEFGIPRLGAWGFREEMVDPLTRAALRASSMRANPVALSSEDIRSILAEAI